MNTPWQRAVRISMVKLRAMRPRAKPTGIPEGAARGMRRRAGADHGNGNGRRWNGSRGHRLRQLPRDGDRPKRPNRNAGHASGVQWPRQPVGGVIAQEPDRASAGCVRRGRRGCDTACSACGMAKLRPGRLTWKTQIRSVISITFQTKPRRLDCEYALANCIAFRKQEFCVGAAEDRLSVERVARQVFPAGRLRAGIDSRCESAGDSSSLQNGIGFQRRELSPCVCHERLKMLWSLFGRCPNRLQITLCGFDIFPNLSQSSLRRLPQPQGAGLEAGACGKKSNRGKKD